jgi:hypothetical protein
MSSLDVTDARLLALFYCNNIHLWELHKRNKECHRVTSVIEVLRFYLSYFFALFRKFYLIASRGIKILFLSIFISQDFHMPKKI